MIIYQLTNKINGKSYIGQTISTLQHRVKGHLSDHRPGSLLHKALKKYGIENFDQSILLYANDLTELNYYEAEIIKKFDTLAPNGYNLTTGGDNALHHEITKKKISKSHMGMTHTPEVLAKISAKLKGRKSPMAGKTHTEETKIKCGLSMKDKNQSEEAKEKITNATKSMWANMTEEQKKARSEKISAKLKEAHARNPKTPWNKGKTGFIHTEEAKQKISQASSKMWADRKPKI